MEKQHWLVNLYKKNKADFIVTILIIAICYLVYEGHNKDKQIEYKDKQIENNKQFLNDWIDRHSKQTTF
jgi:hypothetical protein